MTCAAGMSVINTFSKTHIICVPSAAFSLDTEQPDYDLDSEDDTFVNKLNKKMQITALQFEEMIDRLEKGSGQQVLVSLHMHTGRSSTSIKLMRTNDSYKSISDMAESVCAALAW